MNMQKKQSNLLFDSYGFKSKKELKLTDFIFWDCNNHCDFCFEHDQEFKDVCKGIPKQKDFTLDYVITHTKFIEEYIQRNNNQYDKIKMTIMGGEIFKDRLKSIDYYFDRLIEIFKPIYEKISVQIVSNLLHDNLDWTLLTIDKFKNANIKYILNTSFDFGNIRFNDKNKWKVFCKNIDSLIEIEDEYNIGCGTIMTKYMLDSLKNNDEQALIFQKIYDNFYIDFAKLSGPFNYKLSFNEAIELWKIVIDRFPKLIHTSLWCENPVIRCCLNNHHVLFTGNKTINACVSYIYELHNLKNINCQTSKTNQIKDVAKTYNCLGCKYFKHCIPQCPLDEHYDNCELKEAIDYLMIKKKI